MRKNHLYLLQWRFFFMHFISPTATTPPPHNPKPTSRLRTAPTATLESNAGVLGQPANGHGETAGLTPVGSPWWWIAIRAFKGWCRIPVANNEIKYNPWRLTWNIIIGVWKIIFLSKWVICMFHVNLPGCTSQKLGCRPPFFYQLDITAPPNGKDITVSWR